MWKVKNLQLFQEFQSAERLKGIVGVARNDQTL
jgi:hypothetical protein